MNGKEIIGMLSYTDLLRISFADATDENDYEVPVETSINIHDNLKNGELLIPQHLGHRKILGNPFVIEKTIEFITN